MNLTLCLVSIMLVPLAAAGLALIHQGLGRSRSAAHSMLATLCALAIAAIVFTLLGNAWAGYPGGPSHTLQIAGASWNPSWNASWNWLGNLPLTASANSTGIAA